MTAILKVLQADITQLQVDAIVNAAKTSLLGGGGGGVDGVIHKSAGPELKLECQLLLGCQTGQAKITKRIPASCKVCHSHRWPSMVRWHRRRS